MKFFILIGVLVVAALAQGNSFQFLESISDGSRIIQGFPASQGQFPHSVNLQMTMSSGGNLFCGGSLISTRWILTAAHCVKGAVSVRVAMGSTALNSPTQVVETRNFVWHPNYNSNNLNNDIALVDMGRDVPTSDRIRPIRLPRRSQLPLSWASEKVTVSGWGYTANSGPISQTMNYVDLRVITNARCLQDYDTQTVIASTICAEGIQSSAQSTCSGDSGGALILQESDGLTQIGVVSFVSSRGCSANYASGYVRPVYFLDWINQHSGIAIRP